MNAWIIPLVSGVTAGLFAAWSTYYFGLRRDREERRRERIVSHLIEAYRNIEIASCRQTTVDQKKNLETSIAAIFLFGSTSTAKAAEEFIVSMDATKLLRTLRNELRNELGLEKHDAKLMFLRFDETDGLEQ